MTDRPPPPSPAAVRPSYPPLSRTLARVDLASHDLGPLASLRPRPSAADPQRPAYASVGARSLPWPDSVAERFQRPLLPVTDAEAQAMVDACRDQLEAGGETDPLDPEGWRPAGPLLGGWVNADGGIHIQTRAGGVESPALHVFTLPPDLRPKGNTIPVEIIDADWTVFEPTVIRDPHGQTIHTRTDNSRPFVNFDAAVASSIMALHP